LADLAQVFERASKELPDARLRNAPTQQVLEFVGGQKPKGIAWRARNNGKQLQIFPSLPDESLLSRRGEFVLVQHRGVEYRYLDPGRHLERVWNYLGCRDCSSLPEQVVFGWIHDAHSYVHGNFS